METQSSPPFSTVTRVMSQKISEMDVATFPSLLLKKNEGNKIPATSSTFQDEIHVKITKSSNLVKWIAIYRSVQTEGKGPKKQKLLFWNIWPTAILLGKLDQTVSSRWGHSLNETGEPIFKYQYHHSPAVRPWESYLAILFLIFLICKIKIIKVPTSQGCWKDKWVNTH